MTEKPRQEAQADPENRFSTDLGWGVESRPTSFIQEEAQADPLAAIHGTVHEATRIVRGDLEAKVAEQAAQIRTLTDALAQLVEIIDKAGLMNLSHGVQLGATSWYAKASDRMEYARSVLAGVASPRRET